MPTYEVILEKTIVTSYLVDYDLNDKSKVEYFDIVDNCLQIQLADGKELCYLPKKAINYNNICEHSLQCYESATSEHVCEVKKHIVETKM